MLVRSCAHPGIILTNMLKQVFLNIVLDDAVEEKEGGEKVRLGMVVCNPLP